MAVASQVQEAGETRTPAVTARRRTPGGAGSVSGPSTAAQGTAQRPGGWLNRTLGRLWGASGAPARRQSSISSPHQGGASPFDPVHATLLKKRWEEQRRAQGSPNAAVEAPPQRLFEAFVVAGLRPGADVAAAAAAAPADAPWDEHRCAGGASSHRRGRAASTAFRGPTGPTLRADVLFRFPPDGAALPEGVADFCFPDGVEPRRLERTPSMSALNEVVYGQRHLRAPEQSFVFVLRSAGDGSPLYGVCVYVHELVDRPPALLGRGTSRRAPTVSRHLTCAPRCYCLLTRVPIFDLHFEVLHAVLDMERLERIQAVLGGALDVVEGEGDDTGGSASPQDASVRRLSFSGDDDDDKDEGAGAPGDGETVARAVGDGGDRRSSRGCGSGGGRGGRDEEEEEDESPLRILAEYHGLDPPGGPGKGVHFTPLQHLAPLEGVLPASEADALEPWAVAELCRALSLDSVLAVLRAALLEKQLVVMSPCLGTLTAVVLALVPLLQPFEWQSVMLPVLPASMVEFLEAPVPFIVGVQHKTAEVRQRTAGAVRVNVYKDTVVLRGATPALPGDQRELADALRPHHQRLAELAGARRRPVHVHDAATADAARAFSAVVRAYVESLVANLAAHAIADVNEGQRVAVLLKESYIDSFQRADRPFARALAETQMFSVLSDERLTAVAAGTAAGTAAGDGRDPAAPAAASGVP